MFFTKNPIIIGIESSCDETAVAIIKNRSVLSNVIFHQNVHKKYGGVVPEIAARLHEKRLPITIKKALKLAKLNKDKINAVSVTMGPGLINSLLVGVSFAKSLSIGLKIPLLSVNHIQAHILAHFIKNSKNDYPLFPFICLVISGGHTQIILVYNYFHMKIIGSTLDNSVGESIDKIAKMLGFDYPGGPAIESFSKLKNYKRFYFKKPFVNGFNFSFSGFKSGFFRFLEKNKKKDPFFIEKNIHSLCISLQISISEILIEKIKKVISKTGIYRVALSGGVSKNKIIRKMFSSLKNDINYKSKKFKLYLLKKEYTTDNGAMIAITGSIKYKKKLFDSIDEYPYPKFDKF